jgi:hypothetical protein
MPVCGCQNPAAGIYSDPQKRSSEERPQKKILRRKASKEKASKEKLKKMKFVKKICLTII